MRGMQCAKVLLTIASLIVFASAQTWPSGPPSLLPAMWQGFNSDDEIPSYKVAVWTTAWGNWTVSAYTEPGDEIHFYNSTNGTRLFWTSLPSAIISGNFTADGALFYLVAGTMGTNDG